MRGFRDPKRTQAFRSSFGPIRQHFALKRHLRRASLYRKHLVAQFAAWREFTSVAQNPSNAYRATVPYASISTKSRKLTVPWRRFVTWSRETIDAEIGNLLGVYGSKFEIRFSRTLIHGVHCASLRRQDWCLSGIGAATCSNRYPCE